jgi:hypothetical protein
MSETAIDPTEYPRYLFHPEREPMRVETPEEEGEVRELDEGWRRTPYSDEEKVARIRMSRQERQQQRQALSTSLQTPVTDELPAALQTQGDENAQLKKARQAALRKERYERDKQRRQTNVDYAVAKEVTTRRGRGRK